MEWAVPTVFVSKKNETLQFCIDYRELNAVTKRDSFPIPHMDEYMDPLDKETVFLTLEASSGYRQIVIDDPNKYKTAFTPHNGIYRLVSIPFGLRDGPEKFHRTMGDPVQC